jgi:hypothetical protein
MKQELTAKCDKQTVQANRLAYILYMVLVAYLFTKGDIKWAITNLGIAMVFDPFDANVKWQNRTTISKGLAHCSCYTHLRRLPLSHFALIINHNFLNNTNEKDIFIGIAMPVIIYSLTCSNN